MDTPSDRLINVFGALALGVGDRLRTAALGDMTYGGETAAALVSIGHSPGLSIDQLGRVLRLSHSGTVRLVDRLTNVGHATRSVATHDRRAVAVYLTESGREQRNELLERRRDALANVLATVATEDLAALERIVDAILPTLPTEATSALTVCRFCDEQRCGACPMDAFGAIG